MLGVNSGSAVEGNLKFIFLGDQRVAAVTNSPTVGSTTLYYHADHLGGANILTDGNVGDAWAMQWAMQTL